MNHFKEDDGTRSSSNSNTILDALGTPGFNLRRNEPKRNDHELVGSARLSTHTYTTGQSDDSGDRNTTLEGPSSAEVDPINFSLLWPRGVQGTLAKYRRLHMYLQSSEIYNHWDHPIPYLLPKLYQGQNTKRQDHPGLAPTGDFYTARQALPFDHRKRSSFQKTTAPLLTYTNVTEISKVLYDFKPSTATANLR